MKPPRRIKIGHLVYAADLVPPDELGKNNAEIDHEDLTIRINAALAPGAQAEKLMHEVLHGCYDSFSIGSRWGEERTVTALAKGLCSVIHDNPALVAWLQWVMREDGE